MTWKRFLEIIIRKPKSAEPPKLIFPNLGCDKALGIDIKTHHELAPFYHNKTDKWTRHRYCPDCGTHGEYTHNLITPMFEKNAICFKCGHQIPNFGRDLPTIVVCLRKSAFPNGEEFYFWEFKHEHEKRTVLDLQAQWRKTQQLEFSLNTKGLSIIPKKENKIIKEYCKKSLNNIKEKIY